ncbi:unnamed protein product [Lasius platythorax]|uniref:Uncharacterized protein n=1 Tax=Lasius platythorax TaxID=488582 RepID=A0AAV2NB17_9HYME
MPRGLIKVGQDEISRYAPISEKQKESSALVYIPVYVGHGCDLVLYSVSVRFVANDHPMTASWIFRGRRRNLLSFQRTRCHVAVSIVGSLCANLIECPVHPKSCFG